MRAALACAVAAVLIAGCNQGSATVASGSRHSPGGAGSPSPVEASCAPAIAYGLLITGTTLEMVNADGCVAATAPIGAGSVTSCASGLKATIPPPVSASDHRVYFRDGDTKIRFLTPAGQTGDVTTVPGGPAMISFFSVSPDDRRIAVMVEDMSPPSVIKARLYVEDLAGGGHHRDIWSTSIPKINGNLGEWPAGWHQGHLVLAVAAECSADLPVIGVQEWHVVDPDTGIRLATAPGRNIGCWSALFPSPAGTACIGMGGILVHDWTGRQTFSGSVPTGFGGPTILSPSGLSVANSDWGAGPAPQTVAWDLGAPSSVEAKGHDACTWITDSALLTPDAVLSYPAMKGVALPRAGTCAGRFPGSL